MKNFARREKNKSSEIQDIVLDISYFRRTQ